MCRRFAPPMALSFLVTLSFVLPLSGAASPAEGGKPAAEAGKAAPEDWFRSARFGLFIHWGPVSLEGTEIGWSRGGERRGTGGTGAIPVDVYDNLYRKFLPEKWSAKEWVALAKAAGMKYLVFTTKHHDGFCMFDSKLTAYKVTNSPFGRDVTAELAQACHEAGIRLGFYYSPPDWHHPDYRTENHARYIQYLHGQIRELCSDYGKVDVLWFDGLGGTAADWDSEKLVQMVRELQPGIRINNRAGLPCDFDTPEQKVGQFQVEKAWESCITLGEQWAWKPNDRVKSLEECIRLLVRCAGGDGNLLLNVGPMPTGEIEGRQVERLKEIGAWLEKYGESIHGTRGGPFKPGAWGASTHKEERIYLHIFEWKGGKALLPLLPRNVVVSSLLSGGRSSVKRTEAALEVTVPENQRQEIDTIVVLHLDGSAGDVKPVAVPSSSLAAGKKATASNVFQSSPAFGPDKAVDDDDWTRWATDPGTHQAWLEVDLGTPSVFEGALIKEGLDRVEEFQLEVKEGDSWRAFAKGTKIGKELQLAFPPTSGRFVRLNILKASDGPTISDFQLGTAPR
jgi:alpha-L-fucosidase